MEYVYSLNNESYHDIDDIFDQLKEMCYESEQQLNYDMEIYKAEKVIKKHSDFICIDSLLEQISQAAYNDGDEYAERYCDDIGSISFEHINVLKLFVSQTVDDYLNNVIGEPSFFTIANVRKIKLKDVNADT